MTDGEITSACRRLGLPRPPTLPGLASPELQDPGSDGDASEAPWMRDLWTTLASPETVAFAHRRETGSPVEIAVFAVSPPWAVEQLPQQDANYGLSLFDASDALATVAAYTRLSARNPVTAGNCEVSGSTWLEVMARAVKDLPSALRLLRSEGVGTVDREALGHALAGCERLAQVTVVHRPSTTRLEGTTTSWIDGGEGGLWEIEAPKLASSGDYGDYGEALLERALVKLHPTTKEALIAAIGRGFPSSGSGYPSS